MMASCPGPDAAELTTMIHRLIKMLQNSVFFSPNSCLFQPKPNSVFPCSPYSELTNFNINLCEKGKLFRGYPVFLCKMYYFTYSY